MIQKNSSNYSSHRNQANQLPSMSSLPKSSSIFYGIRMLLLRIPYPRRIQQLVDRHGGSICTTLAEGPTRVIVSAQVALNEKSLSDKSLPEFVCGHLNVDWIMESIRLKKLQPTLPYVVYQSSGLSRKVLINAGAAVLYGTIGHDFTYIIKC